MCKYANVYKCQCVNGSAIKKHAECVSVLQCEHTTYGDWPCSHSCNQLLKIHLLDSTALWLTSSNLSCINIQSPNQPISHTLGSNLLRTHHKRKCIHRSKCNSAVLSGLPQSPGEWNGRVRSYPEMKKKQQGFVHGNPRRRQLGKGSDDLGRSSEGRSHTKSKSGTEQQTNQ